MTEWINPGHYMGNQQNVIHTDPSCQYVTPKSKPVEKVSVNADKLDICKFCADEIDRPVDQTTTCPYCNTTIDRLPDHLPCEESD